MTHILADEVARAADALEQLVELTKQERVRDLRSDDMFEYFWLKDSEYQGDINDLQRDRREELLQKLWPRRNK